MAQTTILRPAATTGPTLTEAGGQAFTFDGMTSESPTHEVVLSKHPVEDGADISDHAQTMPRQLTIVCDLTNSPMASQGPQSINRDHALYQALLDIQERKDPITVVTGLDVYTSMMILMVTTTRDASTGQKVPVSIDLEEVILTKTETVEIPATKQRSRGGRQNATALHAERGQEIAVTKQENQQLSAASPKTSSDPEIIVLEDDAANVDASRDQVRA